MKKGHTILIVEDDKTNSVLLKSMLLKSGIEISEVLQAETLLETIAIMTEHKVGVILLDLNLPDSRGLETLECVAKQNPVTPIIVITSEYCEDIGLSAISKGASDYLLKGKFDAQGLSRSVRYSIHRGAIQEESRYNQAMLKSLVQHLPQRILLKDINSVFIYCNESFSTSLGLTSQQIIGKTDYDLYPPEKAEEYIAGDKDVLSTGEIVEKIYRYTRDQNEVIIRLLKTAVYDETGNPYGVLCIFEDFTLRIQMEESLRQSEERFRLLLSKIEGVSFRCANDEQWTMLAIDEDIFALTGYRASDLLNNSVRSYADLIDPRDTEYVKKVIEKAISSYEAYDVEYRLLCADGSTIWVSEKGFGNYVSDGSLGRLEGVIFDITERKQAEEKILSSNKQLEWLNTKLKEVQSQVIQSEKMASIGQLAAGVAHEINNPLAFVASNFYSLQGYIQNMVSLIKKYEALFRQNVPAQTKDVESEINNIRKSFDIDFILEDVDGLFSDSKEGIDRIINIIKSLRDFSRIDQPENYSDFDINDGLNATLVVVNNELKYGIQVHTEYAELPTIFCNSGQLNQVFLNILVNSAQAIRFQKHDKAGTIWIRTYKDDVYVVCEISDDGPGIAQEYLNKVFDPFFTTKPIGKGTGLGLSISYDIIVHKHHGRLDVNSTIGKGTTFTIRLPLKHESENKEVEEYDYGKQDSLIC